jgi:magnesium transporter
MPRLSRKRTRKTGLPSGTLIYTGDRLPARTAIHVVDYDEQQFTETSPPSVEACFPYRDKPTVTWINVDGVHDAAVLERFGECFGLHRLVTEDIMSVDQRPKAEDHDDYLYLVLKMLTSDKSGGIVTEQLSLVLGQSYLLSFQEGIEGDVFTPIRERIRTGKGRVRRAGADYLAYSLIDAVVDNYFVILEKLGERIEEVETELVEDPTQRTAHRLYQLKRELLFLHNAVWPLREIVNTLAKHESRLIREATVPYLRDVYDHVVHLIDSVDIYREMISSMLDMYLSSVSYRLNEVMKVLTVIATVFMPLTFIVGLYGMNFRHMPELEWRFGYPAVLALMLILAGCMVYYFKRKKWM